MCCIDYDARARRNCRVKEFQCENCNFKSSSKTLVNRHTKANHNDDQAKNTIIENETATKIRKRFSCEICTFKTTNTNSLKVHMETTHQQNVNNFKNTSENKSKSKRIHCDICGKKFNKQETFTKHIQNDHNLHNTSVTEREIGRSNQLNKNYN